MDPLKPDTALLCKLGSLVAHVIEGLDQQEGHEFDWLTVQQQIDDPEVVEWLEAMGPLIPVRRS